MSSDIIKINNVELSLKNLITKIKFFDYFIFIKNYKKKKKIKIELLFSFLH